MAFSDTAVDQPSVMYTNVAKAKLGVTKTVTASIGVTSVLASGANTNRAGFIVYNNSANSCYITLGPVSVAATCAYILPTFTQWIFPYPYTDEISIIRNAGTGACALYELVAK